jgi:RHS repeat-associated protein
MKSFAAMVFAQGRMSSLLILFLIFAGISKPASAATWTYTGPAFSIPECEAIGDSPPYTSSNCTGGFITGSFTFPDSSLTAGNGLVDGGDLTSWSMTGLGYTLSSSNGDFITPDSAIEFSGGVPYSWAILTSNGGITGVTVALATDYSLDNLSQDYAIVQPGPVSNPYPTETFGIVFGVAGTWTQTGASPINMAKANGNPVNNPGAVVCGEPCSIGNGNVYEEVTDYTTSGQNPLSFTRYYNSLAGTDPYATELGSNWRSTYDCYLTVSATAVTAERADGQVLTFTNNGSAWNSDSDVDITLTNTGTTWTLTDHNHTVETYTQSISGEAQLQKIVARDGYTQTLAYSGGQLASVTDSYGRTLTFTYSSGQLTQVATPDTLVLTYGYGSGSLTSVSYNTDPATQQLYTYVNNTDLASITDEDGTVFASWTSDGQHRALTSQHADGADLVTIAYDDTDNQRTVTNALGEQTVYTFTPLQGVPKITGISRTASATVPAGTESFTYDANGYTASKTDWNGDVTNYVNDTHGDPTSITAAAGTPQARTTTIAYSGTLPASIAAPRETTTFAYDTNGNPLTRTETDTASGSTNGQQRSWTFTYDGTGHRLTATNPLGAATAYTYSGNNLATVTDALGHVSKITSYNPGGLPLSMTDPNGVVTTLTYDVRNRLLTRTIHDASGHDASGNAATTSFAYDAAGNLTTITLPDHAQLLYTYDAAHRVIAVKNNVGESINYTLDADGDITQQQIMGSAIAKTQTAVFDSLGRLLKQIGAYDETTAFAYDADSNRLTATDALNHATTQSFDALNRLIKSVDPLANPVSYAFDQQDNLASVTDPRSLVTSYTYNGFGEVIAQASPDTGTTVYTLDKMGNRVGEKDARGVVTNHTFDKLNRVLRETYPPTVDDDVAYAYDQGEFGIGRLTAFRDKSGSTAFTYNARGDILTDTRKIDGKTYDTSYTYDLADHVTGITYPDRREVKYTRDAFGRISAVALRDKPIVSGVSYKPFGPISGLTFGNGVKSTFTYDQDYRLTGILAKGHDTIQNLTLAYDGVSDITSIQDTDAGGHKKDHTSQAFTYDADYRLLAATGPYGAEVFTYDADGNRTKETSREGTQVYTYPGTSNRLSRIEGGEDRTFTYTANGDLATQSSGEDKTFTYDARNRNSAIDTHDNDHGAGGAKYTYNALGERVSKDAHGKDHEFNHGLTHFIYDEQGHLIAEADSFGGIAKEYIYIDGLPIAELDGNEIYYIHTDQLGTPQKMTDDRQKIIWDRVSEPFGETLAITGPATLNLRFPGQYYDSESGLYYNGRRTYDPKNGGIYTQSDPLGLLAGINTYSYVGQNPINNIDRRGLDTYIVNRDLDLSFLGGNSESRNDPFTHTFAVVTNSDGSIAYTYSWGNRANLQGWNADQPLDMKTAQQALQNGEAEWVGGSNFDPYVELVFSELSSPLFNHSNGIVTNNCKSETNNLINKALYLQLTNPNLFPSASPLMTPIP